MTGMSIMKDVLANQSVKSGSIKIKSVQGADPTTDQKGVTPGQMFKLMRDKKKGGKRGTKGEKITKITFKKTS